MQGHASGSQYLLIRLLIKHAGGMSLHSIGFAISSDEKHIYVKML